MSHPLKGVEAVEVVVAAAAVVAVAVPQWGAADMAVPVRRAAALQREVGLAAQVWEEGLRCAERSMRHLAHTLLAVASLRRAGQLGTPELTAAGNGIVVIGSIRVTIIMATAIVTPGMGSPFSAASMMMDTILIITLTIATSGVACTHGMDGGGVGFMSAIIDPDNFGCPRLALSRHPLEASSRTKAFVLLLLAIPTLAATSAKASWIDDLDGPNSGYCETAPPGLPLGHYFAKDVRACPENLKRSGNVHRQKPKRPPNQRPNRRGGIEKNVPGGQG